jgi:hypothetical protein
MMKDIRLLPEDKPITHTSVQKDSSLSEVTGSVHDTFRYGWRDNQIGTDSKHPVEVIQTEWQETHKKRQYALLKYVFGTHMPFRLETERKIVERVN